MKDLLNKNLVLAGALVVAALIIAVGFNIAPSVYQEQEAEDSVKLPSYLSQGSQGVSGASKSAAPSAGFSDGVVSFAVDETGEKIRLISVSGSITKTLAPDQGEIILSVQTLEKGASASQAENAEISQKVRTALKAIGVADEDIKTVSYNLYEEQRWSEIKRENEIIGFRTTNSIQVTIKDLADTGKVIDAAVDAGANSVSSVQFTLSDEKQDALRVEALQDAAKNAREKADSIASGLGIIVGQVYSASESSGYSTPYYYKGLNYAMSESAGSVRADTPITPGDVEFSATVSVQFEIR